MLAYSLLKPLKEHSRARSTKTRIETTLLSSYPLPAGRIREQDPLKQGLKLHAVPPAATVRRSQNSRARSTKTRIETCYCLGIAPG